MSGRQRGFNMVELMVAVAILSVILGVAVPSMSEMIQNSVVRSAAEQVQSGLQKARAEALKRNQPVTFWLVTPLATAAPDNTCTLSSASAAWVVSLDTPTSKCATVADGATSPRIVDRGGPGPSGAKLTVAATDASSTPVAANSVAFNGVGKLSGSGTQIQKIQITHNGGGRSLRVEVSPSGSIRMCDPHVSTSTDPRKCNYS